MYRFYLSLKSIPVFVTSSWWDHLDKCSINSRFMDRVSRKNRDGFWFSSQEAIVRRISTSHCFMSGNFLRDHILVELNRQNKVLFSCTSLKWFPRHLHVWIKLLLLKWERLSYHISRPASAKRLSIHAGEPLQALFDLLVSTEGWFFPA